MGERPCEARNNLLNRWVRMKRNDRKLKVWEKPADPRSVKTLGLCDRWRNFITLDLRDALDRLYTEPLPEAETRALNDRANELIKEVRLWEIRILELGGLDYSRLGHKTPDGDIIDTNNQQYQYFGRARTLPGVKEYLEGERKRKQEAFTADHSQKKQLMSMVDADYYGLVPDQELETEELGMDDIEPILTPPLLPNQKDIDEAVLHLLQGSVDSVTVAIE